MSLRWDDLKEKRSRKKLFGLILRHLILGVVSGWIILIAFIILDIGGIRSLSEATDSQFIVYPLLFLFFAITFGSVGMGIGIMSIGRDDDDDDGGTKIKVDFRQLAPQKIIAK